MTTVCASQLVYTRVETAFSPQNKAGFQTFHKGEILSSSDVAVIEKRVQCFQPYEPALVRRQFFMLSNGNAVLTSTTQIEPHSEITDKSSRRGAFIAHCLIFDKNEFDHINRNPFVVFDNYNFLGSAEEMIEKFDAEKRGSFIERIELSKEVTIPPYNWDNSEIKKLLLLAAQTIQLSKERKSVFLLGTEIEIDETLRTIFPLIPLYQRLLCSFDTCIDGCSVQSGTFWAAGAARRQGGDAYIQVNTETRRVIGQVKEFADNDDPYWSWLNSVALKGDLDLAIKKTPTVQVLSTAFAENQELNLESLDEEACLEFLEVNRERVIRDLKTAISKKIGKTLAELLSGHIQDKVGVPILLNIAASHAIDSEYLSSLTTEYVFEHRPEMGDNDWRTLQNFAEQEENPVLLFLSATLRKKIDEKNRQKALLRMDDEDFRSVLKFLSSPVEPSLFVTPQLLPILLSELQLEDVSEGQFLNLVKAIIDANSPKHLIELVRYVSVLEKKPLLQLEKITKKYSGDIPRLFLARIIERRGELGTSGGIFRLFRK